MIDWREVLCVRSCGGGADRCERRGSGVEWSTSRYTLDTRVEFSSCAPALPSAALCRPVPPRPVRPHVASEVKYCAVLLLLWYTVLVQCSIRE